MVVGSKANRIPTLGCGEEGKLFSAKQLNSDTAWQWAALGQAPSIGQLYSALFSQLSQGSSASGGKGTVLLELAAMNRSPHPVP